MGWPGTATARLAGIFLAGIVATGLLVTHRATRHTPLPCGTALATGALLTRLV